MRRHRTAAAREVTISILWHSRGVRRAKSPHKGTTLFETAPFALSGSRLDREGTEAIGEGPRVRISVPPPGESVKNLEALSKRAALAAAPRSRISEAMTAGK